MPYSKNFHLTPIDHQSIPQSQLNIENKTRSNPLKWNGQFSPQLIEVLIEKYAENGFTIFDPFLGSGTVLLEAGSLGYSAFGTEVNPAAYFLSKTYSFINFTVPKRVELLQEVTNILNEYFEIKLLTKQDNIDDAVYVKEKMSQVLSATPSESESILIRALIVLLDFHKKGLNEKKVFRVWHRLKQHIMELPFTMEPISMFLSDARSTPIDSDSIDLVVTSPPYINVFNYHQQYRASLEYLQYDLLTVAKSEIGSNRKHRGNRFLTVIQYCLDIALVFAELFRICRSEGRIIFIVGRESTIRGTRFYNGEIVAEIVHRVFDIELISRQERSFKNRFGQDIYEDILHFPCHKINMSQNTIIAKAEEVAGLVIENALDAITNDTVKEDIISALEKLGSIYPSPLMNEDTVRDLV